MDRKTYCEKPRDAKPRTESELYTINSRKREVEKPRTREELQILLSLEIKKNQALAEALDRVTKMDVDHM